MDEYVSQGSIVYMSAIIATYIWAVYYLFSTFIPRKVAIKKLKVAEQIDSMKKNISEMEVEKDRVGEMLVLQSDKLRIKGFKMEYFVPVIEKTNKEYLKFLNKPNGYYDGKHLITLFRIFYLESNASNLESELRNTRYIIDETQKEIDLP